MLSELTHQLISDWESLKTGQEKPRDLNYLGIMGSVEGGTTSFMAFAPHGSVPLFAVKVHRDNEGKERARKENRIVGIIQECIHPANVSVPKVVFCGKIRSDWVLVQSIVKGSPMTCGITSDGVLNLEHTRKNFDLVFDWLNDFYVATNGHKELLPDDSLGSLTHDIQEFSTIFELGDKELGFLKEVSRALPLIVKDKVYIRHGDLCRHNILVENNKEPQVSVIDWTDAKISYVALNDILFFLSSYYLQVRKKTGLEGFAQAFRDTFLEENAYQKLVREILEKFCRSLSIDPSLIDIYLGLFLVEQALFEYKKMLKFAQVGGLPRFTVSLAVEQDRDLQGAIKEQLWFHFFQVFAGHYMEHSKGMA